jgi:hypothetical protein
MEKENTNTCDCKGCAWMKNCKMIHCNFGKTIIKIVLALFIFWLGVQVGMIKSFHHNIRGNDMGGKMMKMQKGQWNKDEMMKNIQIEQQATSTTPDVVVPAQ